MGNASPGGRLFGNREDARKGAVQVDIQILEELDRLEVFASAVLVGDPLPVLTGIVEIEHRGDGVNADPVHVVDVEPETGAGHQEIADLAAAVIKDVRSPVGVHSFRGSACS